jgi:hypothetical protein
MLYKLGQTNGIFDTLTPVAFESLPKEKQLEELLARNLLVTLFENNQLMPIFQERCLQEEADIYALNKAGDLVIFELKKDDAGGCAVYQALRYCETAAHWSFERLQGMYLKYPAATGKDLQEEHKISFDLPAPLDKSAFNTRQRLIIVGNAGNEDLVRNVDYWKSKGVSIDFIPYRVYALKNAGTQEFYFEFFSIPYDTHSNPAHRKGVLFDTCRTYLPESIWYMCEKSRVAAFGDQKHIVNFLAPGDDVFLYHRWAGIVAAGRVKGNVKSDAAAEACYRDLEWLTARPTRTDSNIKALPPSEIKEMLGHDFFWARTIKTPYLSSAESSILLPELIAIVGKP